MGKGPKTIDEKHGIEQCEECDGLGGRHDPKSNTLILCPICHGEGYIDWIQKVTGKPKQHLVETVSNMTRLIEREDDYIKHDCIPPYDNSFVYNPSDSSYKIFKRGRWFTLPERYIYRETVPFRKFFASIDAILKQKKKKGNISK